MKLLIFFFSSSKFVVRFETVLIRSRQVRTCSNMASHHHRHKFPVIRSGPAQADDLFRLDRECREARLGVRRLLWLLALCRGNEIPGWSSLHLSCSPVLGAARGHVLHRPQDLRKRPP
ncbi:hypothetical protein Zmor_016938 [Zophobas morio]|uniref:Uncharacterized protein n=1 Tax=Zophobas morio TaxID=2755281 RepID=A0AA38I8A0_9CUCU|nr:hypothetical protein Zmor_016938 [Zophobas morio]